ncbi:MAG: hypothetical protein AAF078_13800 [Planctomycetota bacterium]
MNSITREEARESIIALKLPPIVLDIFDDQPLPFDLANIMRSPCELFAMSSSEQSKYGNGHYTPIWSSSSGYSVVAHHRENDVGFFVRFNLEAPESLKHAVRMNWQQLLIAEFQFLWESEYSDADLEEIARLFDFRHVREVARGLADLDRTAALSIDEWRSELHMRLRDVS